MHGTGWVESLQASGQLLEGPVTPREDVGFYKQKLLRAGYKISLDCGPWGEGSGVS